jgi:hypothetical protein
MVVSNQQPHIRSSLRCSNCGYTLTGLKEQRCPECGLAFDPATLEVERRRRAPLALAISLGGALLVFIVGAIMISVGYPRPWAPLPLTIVIPAFVWGNEALAPLPLAIFAGLWLAPVSWTRRRIRWWSIAATAALIVLSALWLIAGWSYGVKYEGRAYTLAVTLIGVLCMGLLSALLILNCLRPSLMTNLIFHLAVGCWLASYAFPYLGELP